MELSLGSNQGDCRAVSFLEVLRENLFSSLFQILEAAHIPWLVVLAHLQSQWDKDLALL